jgi:hypothetical protein
MEHAEEPKGEARYHKIENISVVPEILETIEKIAA